MKKVLFLISILSVSAAAMAGPDGAALYAKCKGCHGADGSKKAMGVSPVIKDQPAADIVKKLNGYKDGTYGGAKKAMMASQAGKLSPDEIKALADYISKL
ncbi:MAG: cytochrome c [Deferribacterales bacterium]